MPNEQLETRIYKIDPRKLSRLKKNARYMTARQMERLTTNLKNDGALTSVPLIYEENGHLVVLSGNHRVEGAIAANIDEIDVMQIMTPLSPSRRKAIQLSHNAITGQDDPGLLFELYSELSLDEKVYSGLTDDSFQVPTLDVSALTIKPPAYQEVNLLFLPKEAEALEAAIANLEERMAKKPHYAAIAAEYREFDRLFNTLVQVKTNLNITNNAVALRLMADLALERLQQLEEEKVGANGA